MPDSAHCHDWLWWRKYFTVHCISWPVRVTSSLHLSSWAQAQSQWTCWTVGWSVIYLLKSSTYSHSKTFGPLCMPVSRPAPGQLVCPTDNPKQSPLADCQIQDSLRCVDPGSFGFTIAVLAFTSSGIKTLNWDWIAWSAPSLRNHVRHWLYCQQCTEISRFNFSTAALEWILTPLHGVTQITWECWKLYEVLMRVRCCSACNMQYESSRSQYESETVPLDGSDIIYSSMFIGPVSGVWSDPAVGSSRVVDLPGTDLSTISSQIVRFSFATFIEGMMSTTPAASWVCFSWGKRAVKASCSLSITWWSLTCGLCPSHLTMAWISNL